MNARRLWSLKTVGVGGASGPVFASSSSSPDRATVTLPCRSDRRPHARTAQSHIPAVLGQRADACTKRRKALPAVAPPRRSALRDPAINRPDTETRRYGRPHIESSGRHRRVRRPRAAASPDEWLTPPPSSCRRIYENARICVYVRTQTAKQSGRTGTKQGCVAPQTESVSTILPLPSTSHLQNT